MLPLISLETFIGSFHSMLIIVFSNQNISFSDLIYRVKKNHVQRTHVLIFKIQYNVTKHENKLFRFTIGQEERSLSLEIEKSINFRDIKNHL